MDRWGMFDDFMNRSKKMAVHNHGTEEGMGLSCPETVIDGRLTGIRLIPIEKEFPGNVIEIPVEKIVDGEVVVVDTKSIPIIPKKE